MVSTDGIPSPNHKPLTLWERVFRSMIDEQTLCAVVTGDVVGFTRVGADRRRILLRELKGAFGMVETDGPGKVCAPFTVYRGDSFQGVLSGPQGGLRTVIMLRAWLRWRLLGRRFPRGIDVRTAIGVGTVDYLPGRRAAEGDGDAFRRSGPLLDAMKGDRRTVVRTPWSDVDAELATSCALLDALATRWTAEQSEALVMRLRGMTQDRIAQALHITQPAVRERLKRAGAWAVGGLCDRFDVLVEARGEGSR